MNGRILHLASDDKFIDHAYVAFEEAAPGQNDYVVYLRNKRARMVTIPHLRIGPLDAISPWFHARLADYRFVVLHSLAPVWINAVHKAPEGTTFIWLGWGFDYYDLLPEDHPLGELLLGRTRRLCASLERDRDTPGLVARSYRVLEALLLNVDKRAAVKKMALFAPVLYEDYALIAHALGGSALPPFISWNYGSLEDVLLRGIGAATVEGNDILLGNSALPTNNHEDGLALLAGMGASLYGRKVIAPLSYGDREYAERVAASGRAAFGVNFIPLMDFLSMEDYTRTISSCSHVIMNHRRQQALGNIVIMLHLGATVFLREESPAFAFFKGQGAHLWSVQELEDNPTLLEQRLSAARIEHNRSILRAHWSRETILTKTRRLIEAGDAIRRGRASRVA